jgi:hypothetical protein
VYSHGGKQNPSGSRKKAFVKITLEETTVETKLHGAGIMELTDGALLPQEIDDVFGLLFMRRCSALIVRKEHIADAFFDLSTGIAGAVLQKFSNYRKRLAIVGDFEHIESKPLQDFIYESNRTKQILFVKTIEDALDVFMNHPGG